MLTLDGTAAAQASAPATGLHYLVEVDFSTGTQYFTTYNVPIDANGHTYTALGDLLEVGELHASEDQNSEQFSLSFGISTALLAQLIGPATVYRNRRIRIYGQFIDADSKKAAGASVLCIAGFVDVPRVERPEVDHDDPSALVTGKVVVPCWRAGVAGVRRALGLRRTHAQQLQRTGNADTGLRYTQQLLENPSLWLGRYQPVQ